MALENVTSIDEVTRVTDGTSWR